jgi:hypothetical protein
VTTPKGCAPAKFSIGAPKNYDISKDPQGLNTVPQDVAAGDLDGDGKADIVTGNGNDGSVGVLLNKGDGTFGSLAVYPFYPGRFQTINIFSVTIVDLNGDGKNDVMFLGGDGYSSAIFYMLNQGGGALGDAVAVPTSNSLHLGSLMRPLAIVDLNGDCVPDIIGAGQNNSASNTGYAFGAFINSGGDTPAFSERDFQLSENNGHKMGGFAVADFNGDKKPDFASTDTQAGKVYLSMNNGDGSFAAPTSLSFAEMLGPIAAGDFDHDGKGDLAVALATAGTQSNVNVLLGKGDGTFKAAVTYPVEGNELAQFVTADFNGDGWLDLLTTDGLSNFVSQLQNKGDGTFASALKLSYNDRLLEAAAGDFLGNGVQSPVVVSNGGTVTVLPGACH